MLGSAEHGNLHMSPLVDDHRFQDELVNGPAGRDYQSSIEQNEGEFTPQLAFQVQ